MSIFQPMRFNVDFAFHWLIFTINTSVKGLGISNLLRVDLKYRQTEIRMAVKLSLFLIVCLLPVTKADNEIQPKEIIKQFYWGQEMLALGKSGHSQIEEDRQLRYSRIRQGDNDVYYTMQAPGPFTHLLQLDVAIASKINSESEIESAQYRDKKLNSSNESSNASQSANHYDAAYNNSRLANLSAELADILHEKADLLMMMANDTRKIAGIDQLLADNYQKNATTHKNFCNIHEEMADTLLALANYYQKKTNYNQEMGNSSWGMADPEIIEIDQEIATIYWRKAEEDRRLADLYEARARYHKEKADHCYKLSKDYLEKAYLYREIAKSELKNASMYSSLAKSTLEMANYRRKKARRMLI